MTDDGQLLTQNRPLSMTENWLIAATDLAWGKNPASFFSACLKNSQVKPELAYLALN